jgi:transcriptional regulator with XRE-family HTH domain
MNFNQVIGKKICQLRHSKKISQEDLAFRADIDRTYMSSIERGKRNISLAVAIKLASALDTNLLTLIQKEDGTYLNGLDIKKRD